MQPEAVLYCDGGARGNPGPAAAGFVLRRYSENGNGKVIASNGVYLGTATNNEAEYKALIYGLRATLKEGLKRVEIRLDSELIVMQLLGEYKVKNARLLPLYSEVMQLLNKLDWWKVTHVRREENREADAIVNATLDLQND